MISILLIGAAVIREREHGTIEHRLVMPVSATEIAAAKVWANGAVLLVVASLSLLLVVNLLLGVPIRGSLLLFLAGTGVFIFTLSALGIMLATVASSMPQFALLAMPVFLILSMLSGARSPIENMPSVLQLVLQISPSLHYVKLAHRVLFRGAGLDIIWPQFLILDGLGAYSWALLSASSAPSSRVTRNGREQLSASAHLDLDRGIGEPSIEIAPPLHGPPVI